MAEEASRAIWRWSCVKEWERQDEVVGLGQVISPSPPKGPSDPIKKKKKIHYKKCITDRCCCLFFFGFFYG